MSNSASILKIEYKQSSFQDWVEIVFVPETARLEQVSKTDKGGNTFSTKVPFRVSKVQSATTKNFETLLKQSAIYRVTDGNGTKYTIGTDQNKAKLTQTILVEGKPGSFNGMQLEISWQSTSTLPIS
jgi:hypothetical protein